jgi:glycosyltransferase involved in cell wall biosynthesis
MNSRNTICIAGTHSLFERTGGVEWQTHYIGEALVKYGYNVRYLCPSLKGKSERTDIDRNKSIYWYPHAASFWQVPVKICLSHLEEIKPDLIYLRGRTALQESGLIERYTRRTNIPFLFGLSSDGELEKHSRLKALWERKRNPLRKTCTSLYAAWSDRRIERTLLKANAIVCQHESQLRKALLINRNSFCLPSLHSKEEIKPKSNRNLVVWIANNRAEKQGDHFIELAKRLQHLDCRFIMVLGNGRLRPNQVLPESKLTLMSVLDREQINDLLARAILLVNTSKPNIEGFPNVFIQAWLAETAVVSLHANPGNLLNKKMIGVHSRTFEQLVCDVKNLIENKANRIKMGMQARQYAEQHHSFENNWKKVALRFQSALNLVQK